MEKRAIAGAFSALGRAVWDETHRLRRQVMPTETFSALGRAVWDETHSPIRDRQSHQLSVLSVEPYGMKLS